MAPTPPSRFPIMPISRVCAATHGRRALRRSSPTRVSPKSWRRPCARMASKPGPSESPCNCNYSDPVRGNNEGGTSRAASGARSLSGLVRRLDEQLLPAAHGAAHLDEQVVFAVLWNGTLGDSQLRDCKRRSLLWNFLRPERLDEGHLTLVALARFRAGEPRGLNPCRQPAQRLEMGNRLGEVRQAP